MYLLLTLKKKVIRKVSKNVDQQSDRQVEQKVIIYDSVLVA